MSEFTPYVGLTGKFELLPPFDALASTDAIYTCQSVRTVADYNAANEDVLKLVYTDNGLTEAEYNADVTKNISIVSLLGPMGNWVILPTSYIRHYPTVDGVIYHNFMIGVGLGAIPVNLDLTDLKTAILEVVYDRYGITAKLGDCVLSKPITVSRVESDALESARLANRSINLPTLAVLRQKEAALQTAINKIAELEQYIIRNHI